MEGCRIEADTAIFPGVVLYENTRIGQRCRIHAGAVLGAYGFGYKLVDGQHKLGVQLGNVELEDDVDVGANATIDRGTYGTTRIGSGTKLDNLVMIGHNCRIGQHNLFCSQVGIAGSCSTGDYVVMAGQVGVGDHLDIGNHVIIAAQSGVMHHIEDGQRLLGSPAMPAKRQMQILACLAKLPELRKQINELGRNAPADNEAAVNETADRAA
jgi:UDP-3-O-[3-hydroxymyristoyl] glucosamine N-acyltransferase